MRKKVTALLAFLFFVMAVSGVKAAGKKEVVAKRLSHAPKIDGKLDGVWSEAAYIDDFVQFKPTEGAPPSERTEVFVGYTDKALYLAFVCYFKNYRPMAFLTKRDGLRENEDKVEIYLDTYNTGITAYYFGVNPKGIEVDGIADESRMWHIRVDRSWDNEFSVAAKIYQDRYVVEIAIPFKSIRFPEGQTQRWGLILQRSIPSKGEKITWPFVSKFRNKILPQAGYLVIPERVRGGKNFEILPELTGRGSDRDSEVQPGLNLKWGIRSNLTLDLTLNPDYSQIEADVTQIEFNKRYAVYYPEKRPFFLEGMELFKMPIQLFYSRRIGDPLWGLKLVGETGNLRFSFLSSGDESTPASLWSISSGTGIGKANFYVGRVKYDIARGTAVGAFFGLRDREGKLNSVYAVDASWLKGPWNLQLMGVGTKSEEGEQGWAARVYLSYLKDIVSFNLRYVAISPDFQDELGFIRRVDFQEMGGRFSLNFWPSFLRDKPIHRIGVFTSFTRIYDFKGVHTDDEYFVGLSGEGRGSLFFFAGFSRKYELYSGAEFWKNGVRGHLFATLIGSLAIRGRFYIGDQIYYNPSAPYLGFVYSSDIALTYFPRPNFELSLSWKREDFRKEGERVYLINIVRPKLVYYFTKRLSLRLIYENNDYFGKSYGNVLLSYIFKANSAFYVGFEYKKNPDGSENKIYFLKLSYSFRL